MRRIVVATDFSEPAAGALDLALLVAREFGASLHLIYVHASPMPVPTGAAMSVPVPTVPPNVADPAHARELTTALETRLADLTQRCKEAGVSATSEVVAGVERPHRLIVQAALEHGADLMVMGSHGRSGLRRALLGSVAESVLRHAPIPVLVVPAS